MPAQYTSLARVVPARTDALHTSLRHAVGVFETALLAERMTMSVAITDAGGRAQYAETVALWDETEAALARLRDLAVAPSVDPDLATFCESLHALVTTGAYADDGQFSEHASRMQFGMDETLGELVSTAARLACDYISLLPRDPDEIDLSI